MGRWVSGFCLVVIVVYANLAILVQQASASPLDTATTLLTLSAWSPQTLIDDPPLRNPSPSERAEFRTIRPCLQKIRAGYEARLPEIQQQYDLIVRQVGIERAKGSAAEQAWTEATGFIRLMNISELAITDGGNLAASPDFQINKGLIDALNTQIEIWQRTNPNAPNLLAQKIQQTKLTTMALYRERLSTQCGL